MGKDDHKIIDTRGSTASGKGDTSTETASTEGKRGRGRPRKESGSGSASTEQNIPKLVLVEDPAGEETEETPAAPKNPSKRKRKDIQYEIKKEQLSVLIKTTFDILGSREGMEMWKLSQKEAELIADPLSALMAKNPFVDKLTSEYGDWIALVIALGTVIVPRAFMMWASKPKKKESIKPYVAITKIDGKQGSNDPKGVNRGNEGGTLGNGNKQPDRQPPNASGNFGAQLHGIIPVIQ
jgi:hypothetical protein